jgi:hypothetical protein
MFVAIYFQLKRLNNILVNELIKRKFLTILGFNIIFITGAIALIKTKLTFSQMPATAV